MPAVLLSFPRVLKSLQVYPRRTVEQAVTQLVRVDADLARAVATAGGIAKVTSQLIVAMQDSIRNQNTDKKSYFQRLSQDNAASEDLSDYLAFLVEASEELAAAEKDKSAEPYACSSKLAPISWMPKTFPRVTLK